MSARARRSGRGFTLLELILSITIISIAVTAVISVFFVTSQHSADPMARQQAQLIAEAYLDEILLKRFYDPDTNNVCPSAVETRPSFDNVCDYNLAAHSPPKDQFLNDTVTGYTVTVSVTPSSVSLGPVGNLVDNTSVIRVIVVTVTVDGPNGTSVTLNGYRTNYECNTTGDAECKPAT